MVEKQSGEKYLNNNEQIDTPVHTAKNSNVIKCRHSIQYLRLQ